MCDAVSEALANAFPELATPKPAALRRAIDELIAYKDCYNEAEALRVQNPPNEYGYREISQQNIAQLAKKYGWYYINIVSRDGMIYTNLDVALAPPNNDDAWARPKRARRDPSLAKKVQSVVQAAAGLEPSPEPSPAQGPEQEPEPSPEQEPEQEHEQENAAEIEPEYNQANDFAGGATPSQSSGYAVGSFTPRRIPRLPLPSLVPSFEPESPEPPRNHEVEYEQLEPEEYEPVEPEPEELEQMPERVGATPEPEPEPEPEPQTAPPSRATAPIPPGVSTAPSRRRSKISRHARTQPPYLESPTPRKAKSAQPTPEAVSVSQSVYKPVHQSMHQPVPRPHTHSTPRPVQPLSMESPTPRGANSPRPTPEAATEEPPQVEIQAQPDRYTSQTVQASFNSVQAPQTIPQAAERTVPAHQPVPKPVPQPVPQQVPQSVPRLVQTTPQTAKRAVPASQSVPQPHTYATPTPARPLAMESPTPRRVNSVQSASEAAAEGSPEVVYQAPPGHYTPQTAQASHNSVQDPQIIPQAAEWTVPAPQSVPQSAPTIPQAAERTEPASQPESQPAPQPVPQPAPQSHTYATSTPVRGSNSTPHKLQPGRVQGLSIWQTLNACLDQIGLTASEHATIVLNLSQNQDRRTMLLSLANSPAVFEQVVRQLLEGE